MGILYVVGTPIGNLGDITLRAVETLKKVDLVLCEDTRVTGKLLHHLGIKKPLKSYTSHASKKLHDEIVESLRHEFSVALVSDAGTPGISDPGMLLVRMIRDVAPEVEIVAVPGASALVSALSISGFSTADFRFMGFLPHKKGRLTALKQIAASEEVIVLYESTHRILKLLGELETHIGERTVGIAKEITKMHEKWMRGTPAELANEFKKNPQLVRGEFVVVINRLN